MMKKRKIVLIVISIIVLVALVGVGVKGYLYYRDSQENAYTIDVEISSIEQSAIEENMLTYTSVNHGYMPVIIREVVVLSLYDTAGAPVPAGGSAYSASEVELIAENIMQHKAVQDNQIVYATEYTVEEGKIPFEKLFQTKQEGENTYTVNYPLETQWDGIVRIDVILQGKVQEEDAWQDAASDSILLGSGTGEQEIAQRPIKVPELTNTVSYQWTVEDDVAFLTGLGSIQEKKIVIPSQIMLSEVEDAFVYDPLNGQPYPVTVGSTSLYGTEIQEVTFQDDVTIEKNTMGLEGTPGKGLFENCEDLVAVYNIPDSVSVMPYTFRGCVSLREAPEISANVQTMIGTFQNCTQLEQIPVLPEGLLEMPRCFSGCSKLTTVNSLPDAVLNMEASFRDCVSLQSVEAIPTNIENMKWCFQGCTSLQHVPALPNSFVFYTGCFEDCSALTGTIEIPAENMDYAEYFPNLKDMFKGCTNLESIVVNCCKKADVSAQLPDDLPIIFTMEHISTGTCPGCHYVTDSCVIDGLDVYIDNVPEIQVTPLLEELDNEIPQVLKDTCSKLTFTQDLGKYNYRYGNDAWGGFATWPQGGVYVRVNDLSSYVKTPTNRSVNLQSVIMEYKGNLVHELGHCYDYNYSSIARFSGSKEWRRLCEAEGSLFVPELEELYTKSQYPEEMFARALTMYFYDWDRLEYHCPEMYAYIDNLLKEAA